MAALILRKKHWERRLLVEAAKRDVFTLGEIWMALPSVRYGFVSQVLLGWWRDGLTERYDADGNWIPGYLFSSCDRRRFLPPARYRWVE